MKSVEVETIISFGEWIKLRRKTLRLTQVALAKRAACSKETIRKIEADARRPSRDIATRLAQQLVLPTEHHQAFVQVARAERGVHTLPAPTEVHPEVLHSFIDTRQIAALEPVSQHLYNLPQREMPIVGREEELEAIAARLADPACRLLSLIGPGGVGKTALATTMALGAVDLFADGVWWVSLAALRNREQLLWAITDTFGLSTTGSKEPINALLDYLRNKRMLLILDNFEHLIDGVELLSTMIQAAPTIKLCVTSRERLRVPQEWVLEIDGLPYPKQLSSIESGLHINPKPAETYGAYRLFLARTKQINPQLAQRLEVGENEQKHVHQICTLVGGLPLAIEMAVLWTRVLPSVEIAQNISQNLDFLSNSEMQARQRSLRAVFNYSWNLLPTTERRLFAKLSIFCGSFTRSAAESVADARLTDLLALVDRSFLRVNADGSYAIIEALAPFAKEHFQAIKDERTECCYCSYYATLLAASATRLTTTEGEQAVQDLRLEVQNIEAAWMLMLKLGLWDLLDESLLCIHLFYEMQGRFAQARKLFTAAADRLERNLEKQILHAKMVGRKGYFSIRLGEYDVARPLIEQALAVAQQTNLVAEVGLLWASMALIARDQGRLGEAQRLYRDSYAAYRACGDRWQCAHVRNNLGIVAARGGDHEEAGKHYRESLEQFRKLGSRWGESLPLNNLAILAYQEENLEAAKSYFEANLLNYASVGDRKGWALTLSNLGTIARDQEKFELALTYFARSDATCQEIGDRWLITNTLAGKGYVETALGYDARARHSFSTALELADALESDSMILFILTGIASLLITDDHHHQALNLLEFIQEHPATKQETRLLAQRIADTVPHRDNQWIKSVHDELSQDMPQDLPQTLPEWKSIVIDILAIERI